MPPAALDPGGLQSAVYSRALQGSEKSHETRPRAAHLPGADLRAAELLVGSRAAWCSSPTTWRSAPARSTRATFLAAVGPEPWRAAYVQPSRRPADGRYGDNPFRLQHYYQYQVTLKPSPLPILDLYLGSLAALGLDPLVHDVRFVEDNWESPTLGAWGLGWEVWLNGMEVTQFTYFQQVGGLDCRPVTGEITYGLERLAMYLQGVESIYDILWSETPDGPITYGDVFRQNEVEQSAYNFEQADVPMLLRHFEDHEQRLPAAARGEAGTARLRAGAQGLAHLQPARRAPRHLGHRATALHPAGAHARQRRGARVSGEPRGARLPAAEAARAGRRERAGEAGDERVSTGARDFLVEIGTEELPPKALQPLAQAFVAGLTAGLGKAQLSHGEVSGFATPRRLAVLVRRLAARAPEQQLKRRGPPLSAAFDAARRADARRARLRRKAAAPPWRRSSASTDGKGTFLYFTGTRAGEEAVRLLPALVQTALDELPIPRRMHWGAGEALFVRPVHWVVMLFGKDVVPATLLGVPAGRHTRGHRFHAPRPLALSTPAAYERTLRERGYVLADFAAAARAHPRRGRRGGRGRQRTRPDRRGTARRGDRAHRVAGGARRVLRGALPVAAARGADLHARDPAALLPGGGCDRRAAARVHHGRQHREPRAGQGARGQRARGAPAPRRCGLLLGAGPAAAARRAPPRRSMR